MRFAIIAIVLLIAATAMPLAASAAPTIDDLRVTVNDSAPGTIQLIHASGDINTDLIQFEVDTTDAGYAVEIRMTPVDCSSPACKVILIPLLDGDNDDTWTGTLPINDVRLVAVDWTITARAIGASGVAEITRSAPLQVKALHDAAAPQLNVVGASGARLSIGVGENVQLTPQDPLLALVTYDAAHVVGGPLKVQAPYSLQGDKFAEGTNLVTFRAYDRALKLVTAQVTIHKDTTDPSVEVSVPGDKVYRDVPFVLAVAVEEISNHNVTVEFDGKTLYSEGPGKTEGATKHTFVLEVNQTGTYDVGVVVVDVHRNSAGAGLNVTAGQPIADVAVSGIEVTPDFPLGGDAVDISVKIAQPSGVRQQDVSLRLDVGSVESLTKGTVLGIKGVETMQFTVRPVVGTNQVVATVSLDDLNVIEEILENNTAEVTFEVYFGKVVYGEKEYYIKVGSDGLPAQAVDATGHAYNLTLVEVQNGSVWQFVADGATLHWNPQSQITTIETANPDNEGGSNPIPGYTWMGAFVLLGAALLARRK